MSVPTTCEDLLQLIRKSGMVEEQKLSGYLTHRQQERPLPSDVREFADELIRDGILTNFQAEQYLLGKWRGFTIGKYKLLERIGVGGMGQVFLCEHMFMKKRVAIKVLPPAKAEQPAALGRFYREARAAGSLDHPNIVRTHDIDQDGNLHFIVMDYVEGSNLLDVVKKFGPLELRRAISYVRQVALGLDYAFRNKIVHRDIKPGNILIDRHGVARILDMGLARFLNDHSDLLTIKYDDKIVLGTADYVAPEQVANSHAVDIRADIYALGGTFYFLLAGHPPFPTGTVSQKLLWHRTKEPTPIRSIRPEVPEGLAAILERMMAKDPKARYQTPAQVVGELDAWLSGVVPLPNEAEMPVLSLAALDTAKATGESAEMEPAFVTTGTETANYVNSCSTARIGHPSGLTPSADLIRPTGTTAPNHTGGEVPFKRTAPRPLPEPADWQAASGLGGGRNTPAGPPPFSNYSQHNPVLARLERNSVTSPTKNNRNRWLLVALLILAVISGVVLVLTAF
jgi:serine/threonine protein kinase